MTRAAALAAFLSVPHVPPVPHTPKRLLPGTFQDRVQITCATALLLAGVPVHVVSRRLGHADVQTTLELYAHVTEDADMRAVAEWRAFTAGWRAASGEQDGLGS